MVFPVWKTTAGASSPGYLPDEVYGMYGNLINNDSRYPLPNYAGSTAIMNNGLINTKLRWEQSQTFEAGLDLGLFNNRLSFVLDYYHRKTKDLLTNLSLPGYTGFSSIRTNLGTLRNSGFEAEVRANIINRGGFTWDMTANITTVSNKILKLPKNSNDRNRVGGYEVAAGKAVQQSDGTWKYDTKWVGGTQEGGKLGEITAYIQDHIFRDGNSSRYYEKADYLAGREITLSYQFPKNLINKIHLSDASVYITGQNLFYITGYSGTSPEPAVTGTNAVGVDDGRYPTPRTFLFGLSLSF